MTDLNLSILEIKFIKELVEKVEPTLDDLKSITNKVEVQNSLLKKDIIFLKEQKIFLRTDYLYLNPKHREKIATDIIDLFFEGVEFKSKNITIQKDKEFLNLKSKGTIIAFRRIDNVGIVWINGCRPNDLTLEIWSKFGLDVSFEVNRLFVDCEFWDGRPLKLDYGRI